MMYGIHTFLNDLYRATLVPGLIILIWLTGLISVLVVKVCLLAFFIIFMVFPLIFRYSVTLQRGILFLTFVGYPKNLDYTKPSTIGLYGTRNLYVKVKNPDDKYTNGINIGVWHILPIQIVKKFSKQLKLDSDALKNVKNITTTTDIETIKDDNDYDLAKRYSNIPEINETNEKKFYEDMLNTPGGTIVLYLHGNTASRGALHRVELYKVLRKLGYHVLALDYRGYGDSDPVIPTEDGVVEDALAVYNYIRSITSNPVFLWGHSLGTGVSTHLLERLTDENILGPNALVLESPFTNIKDEVRKHPFAKPFKHLPWFDFMIAKPMYDNCLRFESDKHISKFRQPVLILHAEDDIVVPFQQGYKLYRAALDNRNRSWGPVEFHRFDASLRYGHKYICRAPDLPEIIRTFFDKYRNERY